MNDFDMDKIPSGDDPDAPIPFDVIENDSNTNVSHSPLDLGGGGKTEAKAEAKALEIEPIAKPVSTKQPAPTAAAGPAAGSERHISNVKTFFTKLHAGALDFLGEQIGNWLKNNPDIIIKQTNTTCGIVVGKKAESSLIITVWY